MRRQWVSLGAILCVLATAMVARAQDENKGKKKGQPRRVIVFSSAGNSNRLLTMKVVKDDLKLTTEQSEKLAAAFKKARQATKVEGGRQRVPRAEALKKFRELQKKMNAAQVQLTKDIAALLNKEQKSRLEEIIIQQRGWAMLNNKKFLAKLKITDAQKDKFSVLQSDAQQDRRALIKKVQSREIKLAEFQAETAKLAKQLQKAKSEVLTEEQKAAFEKMKGKKIDLPKPKRVQIRPGGRKKAAKKRDDL